MFVRDEDNHLQTEDAAKASALTNQGELAMSTPTNEYLADASAHHAEAVAKAQELVADAQRQLARAQWDQAIHARLIARVEKQKAEEAKEEA